jgi:tetratricopeptide (TPR) repeat protein
MTRITFLTVSMLLVAPLLWGSAALADERPPCSDEADVVRKMQTRDPSLAYPKNPKAKEHLEAAKRAFGVQQYDKAVSEYMAAGLADDAPLILYNLGQTYREAKDYMKAIRQYELFLERGQPGPGSARAREVPHHEDEGRARARSLYCTAQRTGIGSNVNAIDGRARIGWWRRRSRDHNDRRRRDSA